MDAFSYILQKHLGVDAPIKMNNGSWEFWRNIDMSCKDFVNIKYKDIQFYVFSFISLENILKKYNLEIFKVENLDIHGGSNRYFIKKKKQTI